MVGVLFDTNIYGFIANESSEIALRLTKAIKEDRTFIIHNFRVIRDELRRAPKILPLYDGLVCNNIITISDVIEKITNEYFQEYKRIGGMKKKENNFMNDLRIVACASVKGFNLIFSDDNKTIKNNIAFASYRKINLKYNYRTPTFYSYKDLKAKYL